MTGSIPTILPGSWKDHFRNSINLCPLLLAHLEAAGVPRPADIPAVVPVVEVAAAGEDSFLLT